MDYLLVQIKLGPRARHDTLTEDFIRALHKRMYGDVWRWAGAFRTTARTIGVDAWKIGRLSAASSFRFVHGRSIRP